MDERWYTAHKIDARFNTAVTQLNIDRRVAVLGNGESVEFNKACLAMGSRPGRPPVAGVGLGNVIYLRSMRDAFALREMAELREKRDGSGRRIARVRGGRQPAANENESERDASA